MSYVVAVRALCEFTAKQGDLDLRFTPSPTAQEGIAGHALVASRRGASYQTEISLSGEFQHLLVRGRADGYDPERNQLDEIKTYRGDLTRMPGNHRLLHWAQVKLYGHLLCRARGLSHVRLALVYFNIASQQETVLSEDFSAEELGQYFEAQCALFLEWAEQELAHRAARDRALTGLGFPHASFRTGQRQLAEAVYKTACTGTSLLVQAPTGIGKTVGTVFPLLKAAPGQSLDKIFFLTAKTSGRALALESLALIRRSKPDLPLRVLELVARDKACEHPDKACHGESCPLAIGFYDRLPQARRAALGLPVLQQDTLRSIALAYQVCPYYLSQELARWCDVIVGDYNYYFDLSAMLHGLTLINQWRVGVLVDEAHNLIERGRKMYSAELDQTAFAALRRRAPAELKSCLDRVNRQWHALNKQQAEPYRAYSTIPDKIVGALQQACTAITDYLSENPTAVDIDLQRFYFDALLFGRLAESFGEHSMFDVTVAPSRGGAAGGASSVLCIRNILPAPFLEARFAAAQSSVLFSATLSPWFFYQDMLGLPETTAWLDVESPFRAEQLQVRVVSRISTRYPHREASLSPIADLIAEHYRRRSGNYLAFFSSFDYLRQVLALFASRYPDIPVWEQSRGMDERERERFLARFTPQSRGIGFAVLGGAFGEGVDLAGDRLIGAFIATLGLPQISPINEQIKQRMSERFGAGYDYTYLYPGLQKVIQAAGRVIRTPSDQGAVFLIDDRFGRSEVKALFPRWWRVED